MKELMIDLESLGTIADAPILSVGAVWFDLENKQIGESKYWEIVLEDSLSYGRIDASTLRWWFTQGELGAKMFEAKESQVGMSNMLMELALFNPDEEDDFRVWSKPSAFDIAALEYQYDTCDMEIPWKHWNRRCMKTKMEDMVLPTTKAVESFMKKVGFDIIPHNALSDAQWQAVTLILGESK